MQFNQFITNFPNTHPVMPLILTNKNTSTKCLRFYLPDLLNTHYLPEIALTKINTHSFISFVAYCKKIIINQYNEICTLSHCYICQR